MAEGDITISTPVYCKGGAALKAHVDTLNYLSGGTVTILAVCGRDDTYIVFQTMIAGAG